MPKYNKDFRYGKLSGRNIDELLSATRALDGQQEKHNPADFATITDKGEQKTFPVLLLKEYPDKYYNGGALLMKLCMAWASEYDGDVEAASADLEKSGGVQIKFRATKTKSGNNLTSVDVV